MSGTPPVSARGVDPAYDFEFDKLAVLCRKFLEIREGADPQARHVASLFIAGQMVAQHSIIYNLSPPAGIMNPGDMFRGHPEPQVEPPSLPEES